MKRAIIALVLPPILLALYFCGGEPPAIIISGTVAGTANIADAESTEPANTEDTESTAQADRDTSEFIICENRIFVVAKTNIIS